MEVEHLQRHWSPLGLATDQGQKIMPGIAFKECEFEEWTSTRQKAYSLMMSGQFEAAMTAIIMFNVIIMIVETDAVASCPKFQNTCTPDYVFWASCALLVIYTMELMLRLFVERKRFHLIGWNQLDSAIVLCAYLEIALTEVIESNVLSAVRMLRLLRILRAVRLFKNITDLYRLVAGFISTMRAIFWGAIMLLCLSLIFSIVTMQLVQEYRDMSQPDDWCVDAFSSTFKTVLFYVQTLIAGDAWGQCVIPLVSKDWKLFGLFAIALVCINLGFTNLILSVIVDNANADRQESDAEKLEQLREQEKDHILSFYETMKRIDTDRGGSLSLSELLQGFEDDREVQDKLGALGLNEVNLASLFKAMDLDNSDQVSHTSLALTLQRAATYDQRMQLMIMGLQLTKLTDSFEKRIANIESAMLAVVSRQPIETHFVQNPNSSSTAIAPMVEQSFVPKASTPQLFQSEPVTDEAWNHDQLVADMAALEEDLRRMGVDLGQRLQNLAHEAGKHRAAVTGHATRLGFSIEKAVGVTYASGYCDINDLSDHLNDEDANGAVSL
eukprot:TRINITY_DN42300_c0_g1_i1.p1 TRINITY_DN42300_c0_g1~~TRINITY_DN42300_c0_g1_i1.p1  ORF type:complete len:602 (+),score=81.05 TRINITY_DN42300_c0_g1_i1:145-1806(+)